MSQHSEDLFRYITILNKYSGLFKEKIAALADAIASNQEIDLDKEIESILAQHLILSSKEARILIRKLIYTGRTGKKYNLHFDFLKEHKGKRTFSYHQPSIIIQLVDEVSTQKEWLEIWKEIKASKEATSQFSTEKSEIRNDLYPKKDQPNLDFDIEIYRQHHLEGKSFKELEKKATQEEIRILTGRKTKTLLTAKELRDLTYKIKNRIKYLK